MVDAVIAIAQVSVLSFMLAAEAAHEVGLTTVTVNLVFKGFSLA
jgi:hypothetical protein